MVRLAAIFAQRSAIQTLIHYAVQLGGPGLLLLAIADSSVIPTFGSMDAILILFAARVPDEWPYFAFMTLIGAVIGGYVTFGMGREGGHEMLERRVSARQLETIYRWTEQHAFWAISVPSFLPPPTPLSPFILAAGAMRVPRRKFFLAYASARCVRYVLLAWLGSRYGKSVLVWIGQYRQPVLIALISAAAAGIVAGLWYWRKKRRQQMDIPTTRPRAA